MFSFDPKDDFFRFSLRGFEFKHIAIVEMNGASVVQPNLIEFLTPELYSKQYILGSNGNKIYNTF